MDLNYLFSRQQIELMRADASSCTASRSAHQKLASLYASIIERSRASARRRAA